MPWCRRPLARPPFITCSSCLEAHVLFFVLQNFSAILRNFAIILTNSAGFLRNVCTFQTDIKVPRGVTELTFPRQTFLPLAAPLPPWSGRALGCTLGVTWTGSGQGDLWEP